MDGKVYRNKRVSASVEFEPSKVLRGTKRKNDGLPVGTYDDACRNMLSVPHGKNEFRSVFVDYDDSPRRGKNSVIFEGSTPEKFGKYLQKTVELSEKEGNDMVFVNAWNEWGESNYLEPDKRYEYGYLEALHTALEKGYCTDAINENSVKEGSAKEQKDKFRIYYELCNRWIKLQNDGYNIGLFFKEKGYRDCHIWYGRAW